MPRTNEHGGSAQTERTAALTAIRPAMDSWGSPLGQHVGRLVGHPSADPLSYAEAGAILGISRRDVHDVDAPGKLERHANGGVTNKSVQARFADLRRTKQQEENK